MAHSTGASSMVDAHALLLSPSFEAREWDCCTSLMYPDHDGDSSVIVVAYNDSPEDLVDRWRQSGAPVPRRLGAIFANGGVADSRALTGRLQDAFRAEDVTVGAAVVSPGDLTRINIEVSEMLGMWDGEGERVVLCITSLTTMLQYTTITQVFQFLHATLAGFRRAAATTGAHVHLDPDAVDDRDVARVRSLMDREIDVRAGDWGG